MTVQGQYPLPCLEGTEVYFAVKRGERVWVGTGVFTLCWLGIEEVWDVTLANGDVVHVYPCLGEVMVPVAGPATPAPATPPA